ncbi:hypothetical protein AMJ71_04050 [candidate division TA06 bacterium SM1_40]|uniref:Trigger factor n=1 Tax=candidate division TA06 bacterium SM1_40 TaxID=1703773 RepID=A0A0S8JKA2_UNCT6|nr:MAG: hypothetical protein AMJ71_04050 [candidate division TA06 bacterium SM1_40]
MPRSCWYREYVVVEMEREGLQQGVPSKSGGTDETLEQHPVDELRESGGQEDEPRSALRPVRAAESEEDDDDRRGDSVANGRATAEQGEDVQRIEGMTIQIVESSASERVLQIEIPAKEVETEIDRLYGDLRKRAVVPGFRKGKVPETILRARYGTAIEGEAIETVVPRAYWSALQETSLEPITRPSIDDVEFSSGGTLKFAARFEVVPEIEVSGYRGLRLKRQVATVGPVEVDARMELIRHMHATYENVHRPAKEGDLLLIDYETFDLGGKRLSDGKISNYPIELTNSPQRGEFEEGLIGSVRGEVKQLPVRFPEDHPDSTLAGKTVRFVVSVLEVKEKHLPPLDDEFARSVGQFKDLAELREKVRAGLEAEEVHRQRQELVSQIVEKLLDANQFAPPKAMVERSLERIVRGARAEAERNGRGVDSLDEAEFTTHYRPVAEIVVRRMLLLERVADREEISATDEELDRYIAAEAARTSATPTAFRQILESRRELDGVRDYLTREKVLDFIIEQAEIETVPVRRSEQ